MVGTGGMLITIDAASVGTYNLNGGLLVLPGVVDQFNSTSNVYGFQAGGPNAQFNFGGGTIQATGSWQIAMPISLTGQGTIDSNGNALLLAGQLSGSADSSTRIRLAAAR